MKSLTIIKTFCLFLFFSFSTSVHAEDPILGVLDFQYEIEQGQFVDVLEAKLVFRDSLIGEDVYMVTFIDEETFKNCLYVVVEHYRDRYEIWPTDVTCDRDIEDVIGPVRLRD